MFWLVRGWKLIIAGITPAPASEMALQGEGEVKSERLYCFI